MTQHVSIRTLGASFKGKPVTAETSPGDPRF